MFMASALLVVVAPEAQHFHQLLIGFDAVDESILDVDASGVEPFEIPNKSLGRGWFCEWVFRN